MHVINLDMTNTSHQCPSGTTLRTDLPKRLCGIGISGLGCSSTFLDLCGIAYSQVCGKIIGYHGRTTLQMHLAKHKANQLMVPMLRVLVSLTAAIHASTSGLLQQPLTKLVLSTHITVLVPIGILPPLPHHHQVLLGMITSVIPAVKNIICTFSMVMIHYGMEQVVDRIVTVVI